MDGFSYHNIFATKGIEYIITIVFFILLIPFWLLLNRRIKTKVPATSRALSLSNLKIPRGIFFGRNHTWAYLERGGLAKIGLNDLITHLTGDIRINFLKNTGDEVLRGDAIAEIQKDQRLLTIYSPVSGMVVQENEAIQESPEQVIADPYGAGWFFALEPDNWLAETQTLYLSDKAIDWIKEELDRFKTFVANSAQQMGMKEGQLVMQDGGELMDETLSDLPENVWKDFQKDFLNKTT